MAFDEFIRLVMTLGAESKAMLRILQRSNPMTTAELQTRAMFDIAWDEYERNRLLEELIELELVERYRNEFRVELVKLTMKGTTFLDAIDWNVFEDPELVERFEWMYH